MLVLSRQRDESIIIGDNIVVTIVDIRPSAPASRIIMITYTLTDPGSDPASVDVSYSDDPGGEFRGPATEDVSQSSSEGIQDLSSSPTGVEHVFAWDASADVGQIPLSTTRIRIAPSDECAMRIP